MELAREGMENFVKAQKQFLDVIAEEDSQSHRRQTHQRRQENEEDRVVGSWRGRRPSRSSMPRRSWWTSPGKQMNANVKTAGKSLELLRPFPFLPSGGTDAGRREELRRCPKGADGRSGKAGELSTHKPYTAQSQPRSRDGKHSVTRAAAAAA